MKRIKIYEIFDAERFKEDNKYEVRGFDREVREVPDKKERDDEKALRGEPSNHRLGDLC
jgi:hypothetical protein